MRGEKRLVPQWVLSDWNLFFFFFAIVPHLVSFSPFSLFSRASSLAFSSRFLSRTSCPPFFLLFIIFRALSRKLQSMPRRRAMEYVCALVDSSVTSISLSLQMLFSLSSISSSLHSDSVALYEVWYRRWVSLFLSHPPSTRSAAPLARLSRTVPAFNQAPESRILVRNLTYLYISDFCQRSRLPSP